MDKTRELTNVQLEKEKLRVSVYQFGACVCVGGGGGVLCHKKNTVYDKVIMHMTCTRN